VKRNAEVQRTRRKKRGLEIGDWRLEIAEGFGFTTEARRSRRDAKEDGGSYFSPLRRGGSPYFFKRFARFARFAVPFSDAGNSHFEMRRRI
jgi:hypothetical protein